LYADFFKIVVNCNCPHIKGDGSSYVNLEGKRYFSRGLFLLQM